MSNQTDHIKTKIKAAWKAYKAIKKDAHRHREEYLREAARAANLTDEEAASTIKRILLAEQTKRQWQKVQQAHNTPRTPLLHLLIPESTSSSNYIPRFDKQSIDDILLNLPHVPA